MRFPYLAVQRMTLFPQIAAVLILSLTVMLPGTARGADVEHVVRQGDTLASIARAYNVTLTDLIRANDITDPNAIYVGQYLVIPGQNAPASTTYVVQSGDTLYRIALQYGVSTNALVQANGLGSAGTIYAGQVLSIPGSGQAGTPAPGGPTSSYTVQQGDTLFRIALRYNLAVDTLLTTNNIVRSDLVYVGQTLTIPGTNEQPVAAAAAPAPSPTISTGKQIIIDLSEQRVYAYENGQLLRQFVVSTGLPATPTVVGDFAVYIKYTSQRMTGPDYDLPGVPWVMYFYEDYGIHGTYWHNNFGQPMSHGCINMRTSEAEWLFNWAPMGTPVRVIY